MLNENSRKIYAYYFEHQNERTQTDIAKTFNISRQRLNQIIIKTEKSPEELPIYLQWQHKKELEKKRRSTPSA